MSQATRFLHGFIFSCWRSKTSRITRKKSVKLPKQKKRQTPANPEKPYNQIFSNPPDHIIDCKPYDKCEVTEKFVATGIFWTLLQEKLEISRKKDVAGIYLHW
jgi:hypothetical protein